MTHTHVLKKIHIAIIGANGQIGKEFFALAPSYEYFRFSFYTRDALDITDEQLVFNTLHKHNFDFVINCAAYTAVDAAENDYDHCMAVNATACTNITKALEGSASKLVHFSSDYVYHTYKHFPLSEDDEKKPQSKYAISKLAGENIIRQSDVPTLILRTSWVISAYGKNFVKTMIRLGQNNRTIKVVDDQFGAPTYAKHIALTVLDIITAVANNPELNSAFDNTYNYANEGMVTWCDIATTIMKEMSLECQVLPIPTSSYPTPAKRPHWSVLSKHKIKENFGVEISHWYAALKECLEDIKALDVQ